MIISGHILSAMIISVYRNKIKGCSNTCGNFYSYSVTNQPEAELLQVFRKAPGVFRQALDGSTGSLQNKNRIKSSPGVYVRRRLHEQRAQQRRPGKNPGFYAGGCISKKNV